MTKVNIKGGCFYLRKLSCLIDNPYPFLDNDEKDAGVGFRLLFVRVKNE